MRPVTRLLTTLLAAVMAVAGCSASHPSRSAHPSASPARTPVATAPASQAFVGLPRLYTCQAHSVVRPRSYVLACGDGNAWLDRLRWQTWTSARATGVGTFHGNDCSPDCASGHFHSSPASVVLSRPLSTPGGLLFARLTTTFPGARPGAQRTEVDDYLMPYAWAHPSPSQSG